MEKNFFCPMCGKANEGKIEKMVIEHDKISHVVHKVGIICACGIKSITRLYPKE